MTSSLPAVKTSGVPCACAGLDAMLISQAANRFYLSGFELHDPQFNESAGRLVITSDGHDWLATDGRYLDAASRIWDRERIFIYGGNAARELHGLLRRCGQPHWH